MASLRELQQSFAAALRNPAVACAVFPPANLAVYRNNASIAWRETLERNFPVVHRRVGDDYFRQLCAHYRERYPSASGDLHDYGSRFPGFLDDYLAGGDYAWLGDLARLERARTESAIAAELPALGVEALAQYPGEQLERLVFGLQPSLRMLISPFPVFTLWQANQAENAPPTDQSIGQEAVMVHSRNDLPQVRRLTAPLFAFISSLAEGRPLGDAMTLADCDEAALTQALRFLFAEELVCSLTLVESPGQKVGTSS